MTSGPSTQVPSEEVPETSQKVGPALPADALVHPGTGVPETSSHEGGDYSDRGHGRPAPWSKATGRDVAADGRYARGS